MFKRIKSELYFARRMFQWGFGLRHWCRYILNKFFHLQLLRRIKPMDQKKEDDFEVHILVPRYGLWMAYWTIRTLMHHTNLCPRVVLHDDGSIDAKTARMFESKLPNARILSRAEADHRFSIDPTIPEIVKRFRRECTNIYLLMFVDHFFLSSSRYVVVLDNDFLFYDRPTELLSFLKGMSGVDSIYSSYGTVRNPLDVDDAYKKKYAAILDDASRLNSGFMVFDKTTIDVQRIAEYFEHVTKPNGHLIEQTGWGMVLAYRPHAYFPDDRYAIRGGIEPPVVAKHFTSPRRHEMFAYGIDEARKRMNA